MSRVCLFSIPKAMVGDSARLQNNAFASWRRLGIEIEVVLIGNEPGVAEAARVYGFGHLPDVACNSFGTPLLNDAFQRVRATSTAPWLLYANADILFFPDLLQAVHDLSQWETTRFLAIGRRWESKLTEDVRAWSDLDWSTWLNQTKQTCRTASVVCKDYFLFPRHLYTDMPAFAVGRGNWDNWVVYQAHRTGTPVVDLSQVVSAIHQPHGHGHCGNRQLAYVSGTEAKENQRLAGGRHLLIGSHASHFLDKEGQVRRMNHRSILRAAQDAPQFVGLLAELYWPRRLPQELSDCDVSSASDDPTGRSIDKG